jgi:hypothetical protein
MPGQSRNKKTYDLGRTGSGIELELPSGNTCLVKRPGVQGLIKLGVLDSLDSLTALVQKQHLDTNDPKKMQQAVAELARKPADLLEGMKTVDKVVCSVVSAPVVMMPPESEEDRLPDALYADDVDEEDKMFIFQFAVGGTRDVTSFREEQQKLMGGISAVQDVPLPAE